MPPPLRPHHGRTFSTLNLVLVAGISVLDAATPAGVVVGILLCIPVVLASSTDDPRQVWRACALGVIGFTLAAVYGKEPILPMAVWVPNRVFAFLTIPASAMLALRLQRRRLEAEQACRTALSASELNRLLMSLLAHDLRTPLMLAGQGFAYVEDVIDGGRKVDRDLLSNVRARVGRSLRAIDLVLTVARSDAEETRRGPTPPSGRRRTGRIREEIEEEVGSFAYEAALRDKLLVTTLDSVAGDCAVDGLVLRQTLAVLMDNAIRYAVPGRVQVRAAVHDAELVVRVADEGPGLMAQNRREGEETTGSGLGLELTRALVAHAGGRLEVEADGTSGTVFALRLPVFPIPVDGPAQRQGRPGAPRSDRGTGSRRVVAV